MGWRDSTHEQSIAILVNAILRVLQLLVGILALIYYSSEKGYWLDWGLPGKINYEFVIGALSIVTATTFLIIPFKLSLRPVVLAASWDFVLFLMWSAAFGLWRQVWKDIQKCSREVTREDTCAGPRYQDPSNLGKAETHFDGIHDKNWVNFAGMIFFIISTLISAVLFWIGRRSSKVARHSAV